MSDKRIITEIVRMSMDLEFRDGKPPEEAIRMALGQVLRAQADAVERSTWTSGVDFPMAFPMELSLVSENLRWDFHITGKLTSMLDSLTGMRRFRLNRLEDESDTSGIGIVAEGVEFEDGMCALRWRTKITSTAIYDSIEALRNIHGHDGKTVIEFIDE